MKWPVFTRRVFIDPSRPTILEIVAATCVCIIFGIMLVWPFIAIVATIVLSVVWPASTIYFVIVAIISIVLWWFAIIEH